MVQWRQRHRKAKGMKAQARTPRETYGPALQKAREAFPQLEPREVEARAAVSYQGQRTAGGHFEVPFFGDLYQVAWPSGATRRAANQEVADITTEIILLHYLLTADGTPLASKWIAFRNLSGGLGYDAAFQGRANQRLAQTFATDRSSFEAAARALNGERLSFGDASFLFRLLPRVWLAVVLHLADDEFPSNASVLFDAAADHYLPTEDLAVLGGLLAGRLIKKVVS
jgi:hypothetical protein